MSSPVSVVVPCLDDRALLEAHLPPLLTELEARGAVDELVVVDDTGEDVLARFLAERLPALEGGGRGVATRCIAERTNRGFAAAARHGIEAARHPLVFLMNPDVRVRPGFLGPLVERAGEAGVAAVSPRVLLGGREDEVESAMRFVWRDGRLAVDEEAPGLAGGGAGARCPAFVGGAVLLARATFLELGGFAPLLAPFYLEDVDLAWRAARRGARVVHEPRSVVEHHHRGSIGPRVPPGIVRAAIGRNLLLCTWRHLDEPALAREHVAALARALLQSLAAGEREELVALALALEELPRLERATAERGARFGDLVAVAAAVEAP